MSASTYRSRRRQVQILSTILIVALPFLNIMRLDIPTLRFYFFSKVLWVDEFYLLFLVLMLVLWVVVIFSMLYGRVWCGWMCPQTVVSELYHWFDAKMKRMLRVPKSGGIAVRRILAKGSVLLGVSALSLVIGFNLVAYFVDPFRMLSELVHLSMGPVVLGFIVGIAILMVVDIMFWREKFCTKACPYGMMQALFTDSKTQIVRYQTERGEECIECRACVRDCMMGIDIRTSPYQTECIHCGDCVDSCAAILGRLKTPLPTLISFSWGEKNQPSSAWYQKLGFVDAKRWTILGLTAVYAVVLVVVIQIRQPLALSASGDRSTLYHLTADGKILNEYTMKISNRSMDDGQFRVVCGCGCEIRMADNPLSLKSREVKNLKMSIVCSGEKFHPGPNRIELTAVNVNDPGVTAKTESVFFMPEGPSPAPASGGKEKP
jgi:cytochrome c oxidase accessory protein FixG